MIKQLLFSLLGLIPLSVTAQLTLEPIKQIEPAKPTADCYFDSVLVKPILKMSYLRRHPAYDALEEYQLIYPTNIKIVGRKGEYYALNVKGELKYLFYESVDTTRREFENRTCSPLSKKQNGDPLLGDTQYSATLQSPTLLLDKPDVNAKSLALIKGSGEVNLLEQVNGYYGVVINGVKGYLTESGIQFKHALPTPAINFALLPPGLTNSDNSRYANYREINSFQSLPAEKPSVTSKAVRNYRRSYSSQTYYTGPRGGCYYITASGRKQYVDRSLCK